MDDYAPGLGKVYGPEFVCRAKEQRFKRPMDAHRYLHRNEITDLAPYRCGNRKEKVHYHLTGNFATVRQYRKWVAFNRDKIIHRMKTDTATKSRTKRRKNLRSVANQFNYGVTHQDIMDEIEMGIIL